MADFISREAAEAAMTALRQEDIDAFGMVIPERFPSASAIGALKKIPAADVVEVVRFKTANTGRLLLIRANHTASVWLGRGATLLAATKPAPTCATTDITTVCRMMMGFAIWER